MTKKIMARFTLGLTAVLLMIVAPTVSQAATITSISVVFAGATAFCDTANTAAVCGGGLGTFTNIRIWNLSGGVDVGTAPGKALVLTQNQQNVPNNFNFDTSDVAINTGFSGIPTITINGNVFSDDKRILDMPNGVDSGGNVKNEAVDWTLPTVDTVGGIRIWVGYADTAHSATLCADADADCTPQGPWAGNLSGGTFLGNLTGSTTSCVKTTGVGAGSPCWDAGAIRIEAAQTPEPSGLLLLGSGLLGLAFLMIRKREKKSIRY